jgi:flagellar hook assembly protein FlgD
VTDDNGLTDTAIATTTVVRAGPPGSPTAVATASPDSGNAPLTVNLSAAGSFDPEGSLIRYEWDFENDGTYDFSSATTGDTTHTYTEAGTHVASLRVTDAEGLTGIDQVLITVNIQTSLSIERDTIGFLSASGMTANASSQYSSYYSPAKAIDGNTGTYWHSANEYGSSYSYFEVSFNTPQKIYGFNVLWYSTYYMYTSVKIDVYDVSGNNIYTEDKALSGSNSQIDLPTVEDAVSLRITAITKANPSWTLIREFEVASDPMPGGQTEPIGTNINTSISADTQVSILINDPDGNIVRTLVNNEFRTKGSYADYWNCKDGNDFVVNDGVYYAILQYIVDGQVQTYDLTYSTGGTRYTGFRANTGGSQWNPKTFSPFEDDFLPIRFTLNNAAEVTLFVGYLWGQDTRIRTLTNRDPFPAGNHTVYWDGLDDNEQLATAPPGWYLIPGAWAYTLPDNAMSMTGGRPEIIDITADPNYFSPFSEKCDENGMDEGIILTYVVSEDVAQVKLKVYSLETGALLRTDAQNNISSGEHTYFWDGKNNDGEYVDIGDYQVGIIATDEDGNVSMLRYALVRIDY